LLLTAAIPTRTLTIQIATILSRRIAIPKHSSGTYFCSIVHAAAAAAAAARRVKTAKAIGHCYAMKMCLQPI
jgi:hypothetical protein